MVNTRSPKEREIQEVCRSTKVAARDFEDMYRAFTMKDGGSVVSDAVCYW
jgi:hypothetical protein